MLFSNKELYTFFLTSNKFEEEQHTIPNGATKLAEKTLFFWNLMQARPIWFKLFKSWQPSFASQTSVKPCWLSFQSKRSSILTGLPPDLLVHFQKNSKISIWYHIVCREMPFALTCYETCIEDHLPPQYLTIKYIWPLRPNLTTETSFEETFAWKIIETEISWVVMYLPWIFQLYK